MHRTSALTPTLMPVYFLRASGGTPREKTPQNSTLTPTLMPVYFLLGPGVPPGEKNAPQQSRGPASTVRPCVRGTSVLRSTSKKRSPVGTSPSQTLFPCCLGIEYSSSLYFREGYSRTYIKSLFHINYSQTPFRCCRQVIFRPRLHVLIDHLYTAMWNKKDNIPRSLINRPERGDSKSKKSSSTG